MRIRGIVDGIIHVLGLVVLAALISTRPAAADVDPNAVFGGRIMLSTKRFPQSSKSASAYVATVKKQAQENFVEDKSTHTWKIYFTGFLKTPLNDVEYIVKVYEVTGKSQQLLVSFDQYTDTRGEKTISSNMTLDKKQVGVNKQCLITMESKGKVLASASFKLLGEGEHYSGKVDFGSGDDDNDGN
jgi:hypothetical protein